jgi:DNA-binding NarL/FixJ family response regulator
VNQAALVTTVAICDIEPVAIEGLRAILESVGLSVVAAETSLPDAIDAVREMQPSMLIVDRGFGLQAVTEWIRSMRQSQPSMPIMAWGSAVTEIDAIRLLQAGAKGVVRKSALLGDLMNCIRSVASGGTWMADDMLSETAKPVGPDRSLLTFREMQVMELL